MAWGENRESIIMLSSSLTAVRDDGRISSSGPRSGGPASRRSLTAQWERLAENAQPGPIPFSVTEFDGALFGFWPPLGWIGNGTVHVLTTAP